MKRPPPFPPRTTCFIGLPIRAFQDAPFCVCGERRTRDQAAHVRTTPTGSSSIGPPGGCFPHTPTNVIKRGIFRCKPPTRVPRPDRSPLVHPRHRADRPYLRPAPAAAAASPGICSYSSDSRWSLRVPGALAGDRARLCASRSFRAKLGASGEGGQGVPGSSGAMSAAGARCASRAVVPRPLP